MAKEAIGHITCPLCGFPHQEVRAATNGKPYIICDECGMQLFARQPKSVRVLREKMAPVQSLQAAKPAPAPAESSQVKTPPPLPPERTVFDMIGDLMKGGDDE